MSMFSIPDELMPSGAMLDEMMKETKALMPAEFAGTINLMAHPLAGVAAMSALGIGFASQAAGAWFGVLSGATVTSQRMFSFAFDEYVSADEFRDAARTPQKRAKAAASSLIAEVGAAPAVSDVGPSKLVAQKAEKGLRIVETPPKAEAVPEAEPKPARAGGRKAAKSVAPSTEIQPVVAIEQLVTEAEARIEKAEPIVDEAAPLAAEAPQVVDAPEVAETAAAQSKTALALPDAPPAVTELPPVVAETSPVSPSKPTPTEKPDAPDDLKAISGVGPKLEQVLNGLGIWTYAQIAGWGASEVAWVDDTLGFKGRIDRDGWIGQAAALAGAKQ
ncbi:hypothetical protein [Mesorhizobium sp. CN2-181]|uniref:hypothetical protein n=1 Tax=Mesorhizobium yinganensis TaxID=3157707 RepID=UPI0032B7189D